MMVLGNAAVRAVRSALQAFIAGVALTGVGVFESVDEVKGKGIQFAFAAAYAVFVFVVAFAQNVVEDNTRVRDDVPK